MQWHESIVNLVANQKSDGRTIHWIWEPENDSDKRRVILHRLNKSYDALLLNLADKRTCLNLIASHYKKSHPFRENPIIVIHICFSESRIAAQDKLYKVMEVCQDDFVTARGKKHSWCGIYPHVVVTASCQPRKDKLMGRLKVHFINTKDEMIPDTLALA